jgi:two-component system phosphate regulon sensor histidine kinase PhoR
LKNNNPTQLLLVGSFIVAVIVTFFVFLLIEDYTTWKIPLVFFAVGLVTFFTFYFFLKRYITDRLRIIYRSIRKGKFTYDKKETFSLTEDPIDKLQNEADKWADERNEEILKLREQAQFRREFIGNLAHELKTPVFSVQGYILTLLEGGLEDENVNRTFLERASKATDRMAAILEDLDQLTKMEVDEVRLDMNDFDIKELVQDVFEELEMKAKKKNMKLRFAKDFDSIFVKADRSKIGQVLTNIIGNSIAYGKEHGETVVRFYSMDDIITIEVSDNGPGIEEQHLPRLFERFYRVEKSRNRNEGGSGLGLAIAKKIIEAHGQTINVRSTPDVGSTFTFSLDKGRR